MQCKYKWIARIAMYLKQLTIINNYRASSKKLALLKLRSSIDKIWWGLQQSCVKFFSDLITQPFIKLRDARKITSNWKKYKNKLVEKIIRFSIAEGITTSWYLLKDKVENKKNIYIKIFDFNHLMSLTFLLNPKYIFISRQAKKINPTEILLHRRENLFKWR